VPSLHGSTRSVESKNAIMRGVAILASGTVVAQALMMVAAPVLTRLYSPSEMGLLAVYASLISLVGGVCTLRYELAIPLPKDDRESINVFAVTLFSVAMVALVSVGVLATASEGLLARAQASELAPYLWMVPCGILALGIYQPLHFWAVRNRDFVIIARTKVARSGSQIAIQVGTGALSVGVGGLLIGHLAGQAAGIGSLARTLCGRDQALLKEISARAALTAANRYRRFPLYSVWSSGVQSVGQYGTMILLAALFGPAVSGLYYLAYRLAAMPIDMFGSAIGQSIHRTVAEARESGNVGEVLLRPVSIMQRLVVGPALILAAVAPPLAEAILGSSWTGVGVYLQCLMPWLVMTLIFAPMQPVIPVMEWQRLGLVFQSVIAGCSLIALLVGAAYGGPVWSVAAYALSRAFIVSIYRMYIFRLLGITMARIFMHGLAPLLIFAPIALAVHILISSFDRDPLLHTALLIVAVVFAIAVYLRHSFPLLKEYFG